MKIDEKEELEKLLAIIQPAPMLRIGHFCDSDILLSDILDTFCQKSEYEQILNCTDEGILTPLQTKYENSNYTKVKSFDLNRPNYLIQGKFYEYLFVTTWIEDNIKDSFLKKAHKTIKNAGLIILFIPRGDLYQRDIWSRLLEENYFVATNTIDLSSKYDVIISKKMHGWGG